MKSVKIKVTMKLVFEDSTKHLPYMLFDEFSNSKEKVEAKKTFGYVEKIDLNECNVCESSLISINSLRGMLKRAEDARATHVSIDFHIDYEEYDIYGFKIERADQEFLDRYEEMKGLNRKKLKRNKSKSLKKNY